MLLMWTKSGAVSLRTLAANLSQGNIGQAGSTELTTKSSSRGPEYQTAIATCNMTAYYI